MAQIECGRGHLYDPDINPVCPYCKGQRISVMSNLRTAPLSGISVTAPQKTAPISGISVTAPQKTAPLSGISVTAPQKTAPLSSGISVTAPQKTAPPRGYAPASSAPVSVADAGRTVGVMQTKMGFDPVVGWLVCTEGVNRGKSYSVRGGINAIGRGDRMDIVITGDMKISSENHAKVSYSEKTNRYNLIPGDGRNIIYLNDEEVFSPTLLNAYDLIDFGDTKLLFIPLCGERFTWKSEKEKE